MPHRISQKRDIGNAKVASDSYDIDNIYLSEEGWVYRHFKNSEKTLWWDEIIVAGQVKPGMEIHGVTNDEVVETNPLKLGTQGAVPFETGDEVQDIEYAGQPGHSPDYENVVVALEDKVYEPGNSYRVYDTVQGVPEGWTGVSDPSNVEGYPDEPAKMSPTYPGEDFQSVNEYTIPVVPLPEPFGGKDPQEVIVGQFESGVGGGTAGYGGKTDAYGAPDDGTDGGSGGGGGAATDLIGNVVFDSPNTNPSVGVATTYTVTVSGPTSSTPVLTTTDPGATINGNQVTFATIGGQTITATVTDLTSDPTSKSANVNVTVS